VVNAVQTETKLHYKDCYSKCLVCSFAVAHWRTKENHAGATRDVENSDQAGHQVRQLLF
jgi:hypothetical protein